MTNKHLHIGPGGKRCNCCFPSPGSKDRRAQYRSAKRKADRQAMREAEQEMIEHGLLLEQIEADLFDQPPDDGYDPFFEELIDELRETEYPEHDSYQNDWDYGAYEDRYYSCLSG